MQGSGLDGMIGSKLTTLGLDQVIFEARSTTNKMQDEGRILLTNPGGDG